MRQLQNMLKAIQMWHSDQTSQQWFSTPKPTKFLVVFGVLLSLIAVIANSNVRLNQADVWQSEFLSEKDNGAFLFSTADAPYFLAQAAAINNGETRFEFNERRLYPNLLLDDEFQLGQPTIFEWPLLSVLIATLTASNAPADLVEAGNTLVIVSSVLTAVMIIFSFAAAGFWLEGIVASIGGGLSVAYLTRSSIGRIDTDQLNLGFVYLIFGLIILAARTESWRVCLAICVLIGLTCNLFIWWWDKPALMFIFAAVIFWSLAVIKKNLILAFIAPPLVLFLSGMRQVNPFSSLHFKDAIKVTTDPAQEASSFIFPNSLKTVTENQQLEINEIFIYATGSIELGLFCLVGLAIFLFRHPSIAIAFGPLVGFGLLNFFIGNRAVFFSAPMMWFGLAYFMSTGTRFVMHHGMAYSVTKHWREFTATTLASSLAAAIAWTNSPWTHIPMPTFSVPVVEAFETLGKEESEDKAVVATWWDYGYMSTFLNGIPTLHDGGNQTGPATHFTARALLGKSQRESHAIIKYLVVDGHDGLTKIDSLNTLTHAFNASLASKSPIIYLALTQQMAGWIGSISKIANWDIEAGKPINLPGLEQGEPLQYYPLNCRLNGFPQTLACQGVTFDLERGLMNGQPGLVGWTHSQDGEIVRQKSFNNGGYFAVQLVQTGPQLIAYLVHRQLYESTFNELFHFGQIDDPSMTLHYDDYPHIRIYKISGDGR